MFDDIGEWGAHLPGAAPVHIQRTAESGAAASTRCPRNCPVTKSCNIGDNARPLTDAMNSDLEPLIRQGYAELVQDQPASPYRLTAKGITLLSERGAGLNEA